MTHTPSCQAAKAKRDTEIKAWRERWPWHCKECQGYGHLSDDDLCFYCLGSLDERYCSRCSRVVVMNEATGDIQCEGCGLRYFVTGTDNFPPAEHECSCAAVAAEGGGE